MDCGQQAFRSMLARQAPLRNRYFHSSAVSCPNKAKPTATTMESTSTTMSMDKATVTAADTIKNNLYFQ